jgi:hypothetical protein
MYHFKEDILMFTEYLKGELVPWCHENMVKSGPCAHYEGMMEWRYSSTLILSARWG